MPNEFIESCGTLVREHVSRRRLYVGSLVTGEDPAGSLYGKSARIVSIEGGRAQLHGFRAEYTRAEIRDVRDKPQSAQIGWDKTVWVQEKPRRAYRVVRLIEADNDLVISNDGNHVTHLSRGQILANVNVSTDRKHVCDHYAVHEPGFNILLVLQIDPVDVVRGSLDDRIVEVTVAQATLIDWREVRD